MKGSEYWVVSFINKITGERVTYEYNDISNACDDYQYYLTTWGTIDCTYEHLQR